MAYEFIKEERRGDQGGIVWLTIDRPDRLNALTFPMLAEMRDLFERVQGDRSARCLVTTGEGRGFCSGMDHRGAARSDDDPPVAPPSAGPDAEGERLNFRNETNTFAWLRRLDIPVIAAINGACVGAGLDMAALCDLAIASTNARFQVAYVKRGLYADLGGFWVLPKIIGWRKAMELMMTGRFMDAEEAHAAGLANYLVSPEDFDERVMAFAQEVESGPPIGQKVGKLMAYRTMNLDYESALELSGAVLPLVTLSEDRVEGVRSFAEKRDPQFTGR